METDQVLVTLFECPAPAVSEARLNLELSSSVGQETSPHPVASQSKSGFNICT